MGKSEKRGIPKLPKISRNVVKMLVEESKPNKPKKEKKMKSLYISVDANRLLLYLYAEGEGQQNEIFERSIKLYWILREALPEEEFRRLVRLVEKGDIEKIGERLRFG